MSANVVGAQGILCDNGDSKTALGVASTNTESLALDPLNRKEDVTLMVEQTAPNFEPPTGSIAARLDACPTACGNTEVPFGAYQPPSGGLVALYKCTDCGHRWHTSWAQESAA